ncbi:MAG: hypothetical protein KY447_12260 [Actinobacteria bacterium]|nr:hypothetical protein [Actinomycetota bacterium]MBW3643676.1 hypothetical protein [Actinomycetota bacterium]
MGRRVVAGGAALGLAVGLAVVAVLAASARSGDPTPLPVLGSNRATPTSASEPAADTSSPAGVTYEVEGTLDDLDGETRAWSVGTGADLAGVSALARALGLSAPVRDTPTGWQVDGDGGKVLDVRREAGLPWSFSAWSSGGSSGSASPGSVGVAEPLVSGPGDEPVVCDMPDCPAGSACVQMCPPDDRAPVDLPAREDALERAEAVFTAAGVDLGGADVRVDRHGSWLVSADPEVGGLPTVGMATTVTVGAGGVIEHAGGWLAEPERGDTYSLVSPSAALRRLADGHREPRTDGREPAPACFDCPPTEPVVITVTAVRLGLQLVPVSGADIAWLVPSYLFETREGPPGPDLVTFAVSEDDLVAPPEPGAPEPEPEPPSEPPVVAPPAGDPGPGCVAVIADVVPGGDRPPQVQVCQLAPARAGQPVVFELEATDADSGIRDDCASPQVAFGDEDGAVAVCEIACVSLPPGPGELQRTFEHTYTEPGTYQATFTLLGCASDDAPMLLSLPVTVAS